MRTLLIALLLAVCSLPGLAQQSVTKKLPPIVFTQDTLALPPAYFPEMPGNVRTWLEVRHYRIPQMNPAESDVPIEGKHNVICGNFDGTGADDWAAIVFRTDTLKAFVFFDSDTTRIEQLNIDDIGTTIEIPDWMKSYGSFNILLEMIDQKNLNETPLTHFEKISEKSLAELMPFSHDALIISQSGDMAPFPATRYYHDRKWILFECY